MARRSPRVRQFCVQADELIHERVDAGESLYDVLREMTVDSLRKLCAFHCVLVGRSPRKYELIADLLEIYKRLRDYRSQRLNSRNVNLAIGVRQGLELSRSKDASLFERKEQ